MKIIVNNHFYLENYGDNLLKLFNDIGNINDLVSTAGEFISPYLMIRKTTDIWKFYQDIMSEYENINGIGNLKKYFDEAYFKKNKKMFDITVKNEVITIIRGGYNIKIKTGDGYLIYYYYENHCVFYNYYNFLCGKYMELPINNVNDVKKKIEFNKFDSVENYINVYKYYADNIPLNNFSPFSDNSDKYKKIPDITDRFSAYPNENFNEFYESFKNSTFNNSTFNNNICDKSYDKNIDNNSDKYKKLSDITNGFSVYPKYESFNEFYELLKNSTFNNNICDKSYDKNVDNYFDVNGDKFYYKEGLYNFLESIHDNKNKKNIIEILIDKFINVTKKCSFPYLLLIYAKSYDTITKDIFENLANGIYCIINKNEEKIITLNEEKNTMTNNKKNKYKKNFLSSFNMKFDIDNNTSLSIKTKNIENTVEKYIQLIEQIESLIKK